jgi:hypothetical protein
MTDHTDDLEPLAPLAWPPPPTWPSVPPLAVPPPEPVNPALFGPPPPEPEPPKKSRAGIITLVIVAMLIAGLVGFGITSRLQDGDDFNAATGGSTGPISNDPDARSLGDLVIRQRDVISDNSVALIPNGDQTTGTVTLDLCNGTFPSEALRTARLQVVELDGTLTGVMSTEAVLYRNAAATEQAFSELRSVKASCPQTPVPDKSGLGTATTTFRAAPDSSWPHVADVERQAYDFDSVNELGASSHSIAVYLRRGRALLALYFSRLPDPQPPVAGKTTVEAITEVFEKRLAALPDAVVNRP